MYHSSVCQLHTWNSIYVHSDKICLNNDRARLKQPIQLVWVINNKALKKRSLRYLGKLQNRLPWIALLIFADIVFQIAGKMNRLFWEVVFPICSNSLQSINYRKHEESQLKHFINCIFCRLTQLPRDERRQSFPGIPPEVFSSDFISPLWLLLPPQDPSMGPNFPSPEEDRFPIIIYTSCSTPPPLICINFLSWLGKPNTIDSN